MFNKFSIPAKKYDFVIRVNVKSFIMVTLATNMRI